MRSYAWSDEVKKLYYLSCNRCCTPYNKNIITNIIMTLPTQKPYEQMFMKQEEPIDFLVTIYEDYLTKHNLTTV